MKKSCPYLLSAMMLLAPFLVFSQLKDHFKLNNHELGIQGLYDTKYQAVNSVGTQVLVSSPSRGCFSLLEYQPGQKAWGLKQTVFLDDAGQHSGQELPVIFSPDNKRIFAGGMHDTYGVIISYRMGSGENPVIFENVTPQYAELENLNILDIAISRNERHLYALTFRMVFHYLRHPQTGEYELSSGAELPANNNYYMKLSPDDKSLYILSDDDFLNNYAVNDINGKLTLKETIEYTEENNYLGLHQSNCFDIDAEGEYLYVASNELSVFKRSIEDGTLTFVANQEELGKPDVHDNKIRRISSVYADKATNERVHLISRRDGWIIMDKPADADTLAFNRFASDTTLFLFLDTQEIVSHDTAVFISATHDDTFTWYNLDQTTDEITIEQVIHAYANSLTWPADFLLSPDETKMYVLADQNVSVFDRDQATGGLALLYNFPYPRGWEHHDFCLSPDGAYLYIGADALSIFNLDEGNGIPELSQSRPYSYTYELVLPSMDGKNLYVTCMTSNLMTYHIDENGLLHDSTTFDAGDNITDMCISKDDRFVYTVSRSGHDLTVYSRDLADGQLTEIQKLEPGVIENQVIAYATKVRLSGDNKTLYTGSQERIIGVFQRDSVNGVVEQIGTGGTGFGTELYRPHSLTLSHDDRYMYVPHTWWDDVITVFKRDTDSGFLERARLIEEGNPDVDIKSMQKLMSDSKDRFMYTFGDHFIRCYKIDPIIEDTIRSVVNQAVVIHANPFYENYQWSVTGNNKPQIITEEHGWIYLTVTDEYGMVRQDSIFVDVLESIDFTKPWKTSMLQIVPNPADGQIQVVLPEGKKDGDITIYSMDGSRLINKEIRDRNDAVVETSQLPGGTYFISFTPVGSKKLYRGLLIKK